MRLMARFFMPDDEVWRCLAAGLMLAVRAPVKGPRGEHRLLNHAPAALALFAIAMEHLKAEQRAVVLVVIGLAAGAIRKPRDIEQRVRQRIQLYCIQLRGLMLPGQPHLPEDFHPQIVSQPGKKSLIQQQAGKLTMAEFGRQQPRFHLLRG